MTEYSLLESLYNISVALIGTTPKLNTIRPDWLKKLLVQHELCTDRAEERPISQYIFLLFQFEFFLFFLHIGLL
jgi:hypothetical protein